MGFPPVDPEQSRMVGEGHVHPVVSPDGVPVVRSEESSPSHVLCGRILRLMGDGVELTRCGECLKSIGDELDLIYTLTRLLAETSSGQIPQPTG